MNKKILLGMSFGGIAGIFCACGSGDILKSSYELGDATMATVTSEDSTVYGVKTAVLKENCPQCLEAAPSSSSVAVRSATSSFTPPPTMSSANTYAPSSSIVINLSSDSGPLFGASSATLPPVASSSSISVPATPGNEMGTCAPNPATVNRDEKVTWKFTRANGVAVGVITNAAFEWTLDGGTPATAAGSGVSGINVSNVTYAASGKHNASIVMKTTSGDYSIACSPVQVNGAPINGCVCAPTNATKNLKGNYTVDVVDVQSVEYSVTGCSSTGANITSYVWTGATGGAATAVAAVAAKGDVAQPTVMVANDDNSELAVQCPLVTAIDSRIPDYEFTGLGKEKGIVFKGEDGVVSATITMNLPKDTQDRKFACQVTRGAGDGRISGTVGSLKISGGDYVTSTSLPSASTVDGYKLEILLNVGDNESLLCFITN